MVIRESQCKDQKRLSERKTTTAYIKHKCAHVDHPKKKKKKSEAIFTKLSGTESVLLGKF